MTFDSREQAWSEVKVFLFDRQIMGIRGVKYAIKSEKEYIYANGNDPVAIQTGNKSYSGEIKLLKSEYDNLVFSAIKAGYADLTQLPSFNIALTFMPVGNRLITTKSLNNAQFTEYEESINQGDKYVEITLPFMFLSVS